MDSKVIHDMFFLGLPIAEKIIRPVIVYVFLIVGLRLAGKRELLKKELITRSTLESAAHKQGFGSLDEIERATLEPGGTICFFRKVPSPDTARHDELMAMLHKISTRLAARSPSRGRGLGLRA